MAYSIKYLFKFESAAGTTREIRVLKDGYSGDVIQRPLGRAPMLKKQQNGPVHGTSLEFFAECNVDREFIEFYTSNPKDYRVDLYAGSTLLWQGYITPELYSEPDIAPPYDVQVVATDGVGELKLYDYAAQGTSSLRSLLTYLLGHTGLGTDVFLISSLKPGSAGAGSLLEKTINLDYMVGKTCYEVLTYILDTLHATITWWKGAWVLTRETNVTFSNGKVRYFNTAGNSALLTGSVQALGRMYADPAWPVGQLSTVIDPAKNAVTVQAPWHTVTCLQNPEMTSDTAWVRYNSAAYNTDTMGYYFPYPLSGTPQLRQQVSMAGIRVPLTLSVQATAATAAAGQGAPTQIGAALIYTVGGTSYHLRKGTDGGLVWEAGSDVPSGAIPPRGAPVDFTQTLVTWDAGRIEAEELKIENIPAFMQNGAFPAGTLTVYILGYCATVYGAYLDVVLPKGYQDILRLDNGARGEGSTVEIAIGRETADNAYYAAFLQGLLLDSGSLITSFSDANFTTGMDYLAFIARDYALSVALPRAKVTGTVFLEGSVQIPPLVFTKGGLNYWLETWGWNLYEDELEIDARTLPSASLTVLSETLLESDGSTVSSSSGAGSAGGGSVSMTGGGASYFEPNTDLQTLIQLKSAYDYLGARAGLFFIGGDTSTPLPDLYVDVIQDAGGNNVRVLRSPLPLITGGDQIVTSGTPGQGGGGGGGAEFLYQLSDVYGSTSVLRPDGTDRVAGDALVFVGGSLNKWAAKTLVASVAGLSGEVTVAQLATALSDAGYKLTDTIYTLPVATSGALGGIKIGYTQSGKNYPVQLSSQKAYVNVPWTDVSFGTAGTDNVPITLGSTTKNVLTAHQTVTLASGTNNGTLKLTTAAGTVDNIAVKGLGSIAYKATSDYLAYSTERASSTNAIDLNDYTSSDNGEMKLLSWDNAGSQYAAHRPVTSSRAASLYVLPNRWGGMQLYVDYNSAVYYLRNKYNDWTSWVELYHSGNANKSDVAWTCSSLTANGAVSAKYGSQVVLTLSRSDNNYTAIEFLGKVDGTADVALGRIGYNTSGAWVRDASDTAYRLIYHQGNLTKAVVTGLIGDETYHPYGGGNIAFQASTLTATGTLTVANDDAPAAGEIRGGQIVLTRGASTTANNSAGAITFYGRRLSGSYRNGARIASVKGGSWDLQDLVFYTSNNQDTAAPTFEEAMRIAYNKAVSINASLSIGTTLGVTGLATLTGGASIPATSSLKIGSATITWNSNGYLHIDKPLVTAGDQIVISGTPGGGGGATTLNGLDDVSVSSLANNNVLVWDSTLRSGQGAWKNVAASSIGGVTSVVGQTGAVTAEQIASALTSAGYQLTDTTYSQGTGISISGTTISLASTYAGGTAVTLNGVNKAANTASFYAPTAGGAANKVLIGKGTTTAPDWSGFTLTGTANTAYNLADFLTGNQNITLSGDVTGSGTTSITTTIGTGKITNAMLAGSIENSKLNTIGAAKGGTGLTTWTGAYRLIYSTAATTVTTLAPNTSATRKFLRMTGTGGAGAAPAWDTVTKTDVGLSNVENTALSSWAGTSSITTLGTITTGVWNGTAIANSYLANSAITINGTSTSLGGSFNTASITAGTAGQSTASSGLSFSVPYVTISAYGIVTAYGTHTHTISAANITTAIGSTTYAPYHADGYLPLSGGTLTGPLTKSSQVILSLSRTDSYFTAIEFLGKVDGTVDTALGRIGYSTTGAWVRDASDSAYRYIWHSGNSNLSTVDWSVKDLTAAGNIYLPNLGNLYGKNSSGTDLRMMYVSSSNNLIIGIDFATAGTTYIYGDTVSFRAGGTSSIVNIESTGIKPYTTDTTTLGTSSLRWSNIYGNDMELIKSGGNASIILRGTSNANVAGGSIYFYSRSNKYNGFRIGTVGATYDRQSLVFYISGTGAGEYISDTWTQAMRIHYNGKVKIGTGTPSQALDVTGSILSTGDQVVSSDLTKKTNLVPIDLKVEQIAGAPAVTFDWKTGGHSFGSIAQYWKDVLGEAVLGTEGNYALAYGQLALVNTIIEAREIDKLKARVAALEAEVKRLTAN